MPELRFLTAIAPQLRRRRAEKVAAFIQAARTDAIEPAAIGLFVRSRNELPRARAAVAKAGVEATELSGRSEGETGRIALGTMHFAKGLELPRCGCNGL